MRVKVFKKRGRKVLYLLDIDLLTLISERLIFGLRIAGTPILKGKFYIQVDDKVETHKLD